MRVTLVLRSTTILPAFGLDVANFRRNSASKASKSCWITSCCHHIFTYSVAKWTERRKENSNPQIPYTFFFLLLFSAFFQAEIFFWLFYTCSSVYSYKYQTDWYVCPSPLRYCFTKVELHLQRWLPKEEPPPSPVVTTLNQFLASNPFPAFQLCTNFHRAGQNKSTFMLFHLQPFFTDVELPSTWNLTDFHFSNVYLRQLLHSISSARSDLYFPENHSTFRCLICASNRAGKFLGLVGKFCSLGHHRRRIEQSSHGQGIKSSERLPPVDGAFPPAAVRNSRSPWWMALAGFPRWAFSPSLNSLSSWR